MPECSDENEYLCRTYSAEALTMLSRLSEGYITHISILKLREEHAHEEGLLLLPSSPLPIFFIVKQICI
jgi:hypothetical protein